MQYKLAHTDVPTKWIKTYGWCVDSKMKDQNDGAVVLRTRSSAEACLTECKRHVDATGCEYTTKGICAYHSKEVATGSRSDSTYSCWVKSGTINIKHQCRPNYFNIE